jgi:hypothetical protein
LFLKCRDLAAKPAIRYKMPDRSIIREIRRYWRRPVVASWNGAEQAGDIGFRETTPAPQWDVNQDFLILQIRFLPPEKPKRSSLSSRKGARKKLDDQGRLRTTASLFPSSPWRACNIKKPHPRADADGRRTGACPRSERDVRQGAQKGSQMVLPGLVRCSEKKRATLCIHRKK